MAGSDFSVGLADTVPISIKETPPPEAIPTTPDNTFEPPSNGKLIPVGSFPRNVLTLPQTLSGSFRIIVADSTPKVEPDNSQPTRPTDQQLLPSRLPGVEERSISPKLDTQGRYTGSTLKLTQELLNVNRGVFLGETHSDSFARNFLVSNMAGLAASGVEVVFLECIEASDQAAIDAYMQAGANTPQEAAAREKLLQIIADKWGWSPGEYMAVIDAAKSAGVQVRGIDERDGPFTTKLDEDSSRDITWRNQFWSNTINGVMAEKFASGDKFIVLGGSAHTGDAIRYGETPATASLPMYGADHPLEVPAIRFDRPDDSVPNEGIYPVESTPFGRETGDWYVIQGERESILLEIKSKLPEIPMTEMR